MCVFEKSEPTGSLSLVKVWDLHKRFRGSIGKLGDLWGGREEGG